MQASITARNFRRKTPAPNYFDRRRHEHAELWVGGGGDIQSEGRELEDGITLSWIIRALGVRMGGGRNCHRIMSSSDDNFQLHKQTASWQVIHFITTHTQILRTTVRNKPESLCTLCDDR
jgi:hypothetical protein